MTRFITLVAAIALFTLSGCNTMRGIGQDISKTGDTISGAAR